MRVRFKVLAPALLALGSWLASPHALALVSEEHSHYLMAASSLILLLTPALVTNRPRTHKPPKIDKKLQAFGIPADAPHALPVDRGE
jgi:hypothetical protein